MREIPRRSRKAVSARRLASAGLAAASILALFLSQPFHAPAPSASAAGPALAAAPLGPGGVASEQPAHDAESCPQCRAFAKTRLGLRTPVASGLAAAEPLLPLQWPPPAPPSAAAELRLTPPRAPPSA
jgi:hypothetical protein